MAVKTYKPTSPGRRGMSVVSYEGLTKKKPEKSLTEDIRENAGRNNKGRITVRHKGGRTRRKYRIIDFKRTKDNVPAKVASLEYDPNRTAFIALLNYADGEKRYILAPLGLKVGDVIYSGTEGLDIKVGNSMPITAIPVGTMIHNIELIPVSYTHLTLPTTPYV
jgi:large subunit ribosomal protein L2